MSSAHRTADPNLSQQISHDIPVCFGFRYPVFELSVARAPRFLRQARHAA